MQNVWHQVQPCNLEDEKNTWFKVKSYQKASYYSTDQR